MGHPLSMEPGLGHQGFLLGKKEKRNPPRLFQSCCTLKPVMKALFVLCNKTFYFNLFISKCLGYKKMSSCDKCFRFHGSFIGYLSPTNFLQGKKISSDTGFPLFPLRHSVPSLCSLSKSLEHLRKKIFCRLVGEEAILGWKR